MSDKLLLEIKNGKLFHQKFKLSLIDVSILKNLQTNAYLFIITQESLNTFKKIEKKVLLKFLSDSASSGQNFKNFYYFGKRRT